MEHSHAPHWAARAILCTMADLQIAPPREKNVLPAILIALLVLGIVAFAVFYFNPHKVADLRVADVQTFAPHTEMKSLETGRTGGMRVLGGKEVTAEDDLYVIATLNFTDRLRLPLYLEGATAHATFADGSEAQAQMIPVMNIKRLEGIFPAIAPLVANPIADDEEIDPQKTRVGVMVFAFPNRDAAAWKGKRDATITLELRDQGPQTTRLP